MTAVLEHLDESQRKDVDSKVSTLHKHWTQLKDVAKIRADITALLITFLDDSESLENAFNEVEKILGTSTSEETLQRINKAWEVIKPAYQEIKSTGARVIAELDKVCKSI